MTKKLRTKSIHHQKDHTLYLWDLTGTLFPEQWSSTRTGFASYGDWLQNRLGKKFKDISNREFEEGYKIPYTQGWYFNLKIAPYFKQVLSWTKHNETFSTGNIAQMNWRAKYLNPQVSFDIRKYFQKFNSTFDYGRTNKKTPAMLVDYLKHKYFEGYKTVVYADDSQKNLEFFQQAGQIVRKQYSDFHWRLYHILNNRTRLKKKKRYFSVGNLLDLLRNEKIFRKKNN